MKQKTKGLFGILAVLMLSVVSASAVMADNGNNAESSSMEMDGMMHDFDSGREFGQHVREHNDMFSGTMNPGVHHNGYSTLKG